MLLALIVALAAWVPTATASEPDRDDVEVRVVMLASCLTIHQSTKNLLAVNDAHVQWTFAVMVISFDFGG
jgi:hypothetical protein